MCRTIQLLLNTEDGNIVSEIHVCSIKQIILWNLGVYILFNDTTPNSALKSCASFGIFMIFNL